MMLADFVTHEGQWCARCRHDGRGSKACPVRAIMRKNPDDYACMHLFRTGKCSEFEQKPKRPKKAKEAKK